MFYFSIIIRGGGQVLIKLVILYDFKVLALEMSCVNLFEPSSQVVNH